jgi:hypothetical protein
MFCKHYGEKIVTRIALIAGPNWCQTLFYSLVGLGVASRLEKPKGFKYFRRFFMNKKRNKTGASRLGSIHTSILIRCVGKSGCSGLITISNYIN